MQDLSPTTLITPPAIDAQPAPLFGISPAVLIGIGLLCICFYFAFVYRHRRRIDPRELAFRSICHKMGLTRAQIGRIRKHAVSSGLTSPVGIVMNPDLFARALQDPA